MNKLKKLLKDSFNELNNPFTNNWNSFNSFEKKIIILHYFCDWDIKEIADNLGYEYETIKRIYKECFNIIVEIEKKRLGLKHKNILTMAKYNKKKSKYYLTDIEINDIRYLRYERKVKAK